MALLWYSLCSWHLSRVPWHFLTLVSLFFIVGHCKVLLSWHFNGTCHLFSWHLSSILTLLTLAWLFDTCDFVLSLVGHCKVIVPLWHLSFVIMTLIKRILTILCYHLFSWNLWFLSLAWHFGYDTSFHVS